MTYGDAIIEELSKRKGFEGWWDSISEEIQDDIKHRLNIVVEREITKTNT